MQWIVLLYGWGTYSIVLVSSFFWVSPGPTPGEWVPLICVLLSAQEEKTSVTANPGKAWNDPLSYLGGNAMCSNPADSESQPCPVLVYVNCKDYWKSSTNLNSIIYPMNFGVCWEVLFFFFSFSFHLMQVHGNPCGSAGTHWIMKELQALRELEHD